MGFRQSQMRNAPCRTEQVGQGLAREGGGSLPSVIPREGESEKMSVERREATSPTLLNLGRGCAPMMSKRTEDGLGSVGESEGAGGGEDASLVREREHQSRLAVSWQERPFAFI